MVDHRAAQVEILRRIKSSGYQKNLTLEYVCRILRKYSEKKNNAVRLLDKSLNIATKSQSFSSRKYKTSDSHQNRRETLRRKSPTH